MKPPGWTLVADEGAPSFARARALRAALTLPLDDAEVQRVVRISRDPSAPLTLRLAALEGAAKAHRLPENSSHPIVQRALERLLR